MSKKNTLNSSEAVKKAKEYLTDFYEDIESETIRLEEVERQSNSWVITISFKQVSETGESERMSKSLTAPKRQYKVFTLKKNGELKSMKRRDMA